MLSVAHVEALNAIPVDFYGENNNLREINETWKLYLDHHTLNVTTSDVWMEKRLSLFHDILHLISVYLGYRFTRSQIARDIYSPQAHSDLENEQTIIRRGLVKLFNMEISLPMAVTEFPATADDESLANHRDIQKAILEVLEGRRPLPVTNVPDAIG